MGPLSFEGNPPVSRLEFNPLLDQELLTKRESYNLTHKGERESERGRVCEGFPELLLRTFQAKGAGRNPYLPRKVLTSRSPITLIKRLSTSHSEQKFSGSTHELAIVEG